jgi:hypothetical protein
MRDRTLSLLIVLVLVIVIVLDLFGRLGGWGAEGGKIEDDNEHEHD